MLVALLKQMINIQGNWIAMTIVPSTSETNDSPKHLILKILICPSMEGKYDIRPFLLLKPNNI